MTTFQDVRRQAVCPTGREREPIRKRRSSTRGYRGHHNAAYPIDVFLTASDPSGSIRQKVTRHNHRSIRIESAEEETVGSADQRIAARRTGCNGDMELLRRRCRATCARSRIPHLNYEIGSAQENRNP